MQHFQETSLWGLSRFFPNYFISKEETYKNEIKLRQKTIFEGIRIEVVI